MADVTIICPHCGQRISAAEEFLGMIVECPSCEQSFEARSENAAETIPDTSPEPFPESLAPPQSKSRKRGALNRLVMPTLYSMVAAGVLASISGYAWQKGWFGLERVDSYWQRVEDGESPTYNGRNYILGTHYRFRTPERWLYTRSFVEVNWNEPDDGENEIGEVLCFRLDSRESEPSHSAEIRVFQKASFLNDYYDEFPSHLVVNSDSFEELQSNAEKRTIGGTVTSMVNDLAEDGFGKTYILGRNGSLLSVTLKVGSPALEHPSDFDDLLKEVFSSMISEDYSDYSPVYFDKIVEDNRDALSGLSRRAIRGKSPFSLTTNDLEKAFGESRPDDNPDPLAEKFGFSRSVAFNNIPYSDTNKYILRVRAWFGESGERPKLITFHAHPEAFGSVLKDAIDLFTTEFSSWDDLDGSVASAFLLSPIHQFKGTGSLENCHAIIYTEQATAIILPEEIWERLNRGTD